jgi:hypothetical protein
MGAMRRNRTLPEPNLNRVLRRLDALQRELREGFHTMELRREASHQRMMTPLAGLETVLADMLARAHQ